MKLLISDMHFGLRMFSILTMKKWRDRFFSELKKLEEEKGEKISEIIIIGDALDFWMSNEQTATKQARPFFEELGKLGAKVTYIVGNHDYELIDKNFQNKLPKTKMPWTLKLDDWFQDTLGMVPDSVVYPDACFTVGTGKNTRCVIATHGHYTCRSQQVVPRILWAKKNAQGEDVIRDFERKYKTATPTEQEFKEFYDIMHDLGEHIGSYGWLGVVLCRMASMFGKDTAKESHLEKKSMFLSGKNAETAEKNAEAYMRHVSAVEGRGKVDCFIHGHTHDCWLVKRDGSYLVGNTGCWYNPFTLFHWKDLSINTFFTISEKDKPMLDAWQLRKDGTHKLQSFEL